MILFGPLLLIILWVIIVINYYLIASLNLIPFRGNIIINNPIYDFIWSIIINPNCGLLLLLIII